MGELKDLEEGPTETKEEEEANKVKEFGESTKEERVTLLSNGGASQEEQSQTEEPRKYVENVEDNKIKSEGEKNEKEEGSHKEEDCKTEPVEVREEPSEDKTEDDSDDALSTDKEDEEEEEEDTPCLTKESPAIQSSVSDTAALRAPPRLTTQVSVHSVREVFFDRAPRHRGSELVAVQGGGEADDHQHPGAGWDDRQGEVHRDHDGLLPQIQCGNQQEEA